MPHSLDTCRLREEEGRGGHLLFPFSLLLKDSQRACGNHGNSTSSRLPWLCSPEATRAGQSPWAPTQPRVPKQP